MPEAAPRRTALYDLHTELGARFTEFGGWDMPVRYGSIIDEHRAVRQAAGLFDLSHMGELRVAGAGAGPGLSAALVNDPRRLRPGRAGYSLLCGPDGGIIDDLIVYRLGHERYLVVPNASNRETVAAVLAERLAGHDAELEDQTLATSLVAVQGPGATVIVSALTEEPLASIGRYGAVETTVAGQPVLLARTGYTGEDGFELFCAWDDGPALWAALADAGADVLRPCGLGARDTLRLEAGMPLYGNELDLGTTPFEAGLGWAVQLDREFVGREALAASAASPRKRLVGLVLRDRGIARHGHAVTAPGRSAPVGVVTSGSQSPTLGAAVAMAYVRPDVAAAGTMLEVIVRGAAVPAEVVPLPFYRRSGR
ncbi:MAG: glycine cleavage system aminomethyltransferase GcvT [Candidatus Limnocylindrales bacterium]